MSSPQTQTQADRIVSTIMHRLGNDIGSAIGNSATIMREIGCQPQQAHDLCLSASFHSMVAALKAQGGQGDAAAYLRALIASLKLSPAQIFPPEPKRKGGFFRRG